MSKAVPVTMRVLTSTVSADGEIVLAVTQQKVPQPMGDEVLLRIEAAPVNPSDIGALLGVADPTSFVLASDGNSSSAPIAERARRLVVGRVGIALVPGLEGAGTVVAMGPGAKAQALIGRTVAITGGGTYAQYRLTAADDCLVLPDGITPAQGASAFVNPMTVLCMVDKMRREGHSAIVHTAASSNLGLMLVKVCREEGIPLVNVVRGEGNLARLRALGAEYVCDSTAPTFFADLVTAIQKTGARLAFDAVGGGRLANQILAAMEASSKREGAFASQYGSAERKVVCIYGTLNTRPTELTRSYGMAWSVVGWLYFHHLETIEPELVSQMQARVAAGLTGTFVSHYSRTIGLDDLIRPETIAAFSRLASGEKFLVTPN